MQSVKAKDTGPEWAVRRMLFAKGYRYRLHCRKLPGKPDIVMPGRRKAIFVHGCFWHGHGCTKGRLPKSKHDYWGTKIAENQARDARNIAALRELGWDTMVVWQCELSDQAGISERLESFVEGSDSRRDKTGTEL